MYKREVNSMNLNQPTLIQFETERKNNNVIPPKGSNSFYTIGDGEINLLVERDDPDDYRFNLYTNKGHVYTGIGDFRVSGDIKDNDNPYKDMIIITNTELSVNKSMTLSKGKFEIHGTLELMKGAELIICNDAEVIIYSDAKFIVNDESNITISGNSSMRIYGLVNIHLSAVNTIINNPSIIVDSAAVMEVKGLDVLGDRTYSLTDYYTELTNRIINKHTQGEKNYKNGRIGYTWTGGDPLNRSQQIKMSTLWGTAVLGDFKLSVLGLPEEDILNLQMISDLHIQKNTTLYITETYNDERYVMPNLYLGIIIGNVSRTGSCVVDGKIIVNGKNALINIDRKATMYINKTGEVYIQNGATLLSTYNDDESVLFIDGTLVIETIEQINTFNHDNIVIGPTGKVVILNPDTGEKKLLWSTPNGIKNTDLYRLFEDRIDHVEYHISNNNGIAIDKYFEFYATQMTKWYGDRRIEQAIKDGIIVWHDGGFIELNKDIIPWVDVDCTLLQASRLFKTFGSYDEDKLQDAVNRLHYAGCGNILFRFINGENVGEIMMVLEDITMENIVNYPLTDTYLLDTSNKGKVFLRNKIGEATQENIINKKSKVVEIEETKTKFTLK